MSGPDDRQARMSETVRLIITQRERAPRSPAMERAFKRLIWRYSRALAQEKAEPEDQATLDRDTECFE